MPPDPINEVNRPAVSWQDFDDVVNSGFVNDDDKLDLIEDLYSNTAISHTGVWGRGWRMTESDKARCFEIRSALADAIRFKADVGPGKTTGNAVLDTILKRIEETQTPLTKREVRQVLNEVGKIVDILSARRVLTVSINKADDICRPGGQAKKLESGVVALRQRVMGAKNIQDKDALLVRINELLVKQNDVIKGFASLCGSANKHLLAPADDEAEYIDARKTASKNLLEKAKKFDELEDEFEKLRKWVDERFEKTAFEDQIAALEKKINFRKSLSGDGDEFDSALDKLERKLKSARRQLKEVDQKIAAEAKDLLRVKVVKTEAKGEEKSEKVKVEKKVAREKIDDMRDLQGAKENEMVEMKDMGMKEEIRKEEKNEKSEKQEDVTKGKDDKIEGLGTEEIRQNPEPQNPKQTETEELQKQNEEKSEVKKEVKTQEPPKEEIQKQPDVLKQNEPKVDEKKSEAKEEVKNQEQQKQEPPKNVPPKDNLVKNNLDKFVLKGVFKKDVLPGFKCNYAYGSKAYDEALQKHNEDIDTKIRKEILPNWTTLTSRLDALRWEAMKALGVTPELEDWFKHWHPEFDWSSDSFIGKVREEKINGKSVKEVEDAILAACQIKNTGKLYVSGNGGEFREINLVVVVGKMKIKQADNTRYIYIDKENGSLTNDDVDKAIEEFCEKENLKEEKGFRVWADEQIGGVLDMAANVHNFNVAYQECVKNPDALDKLLNEEVNRLNHFTDDERKEIAGLIRKAVIDPIKNAKNIWNIKGLTFMRNFTGLCKNETVQDAQGVMKVVRDIVWRQAEGNFKVSSNGVKCLLRVDDVEGQMVNQVKWNRQGNNWTDLAPSKVIGSAIEKNRGLVQVGGNNCFMVSIVNALLCNEKGRGILKNCFCNGDGKYHFKDGSGKELVIADDDVSKWEQKNQRLRNMSKLERVIWTAWLKDRFETPDKYGNDGKERPGDQGTAGDVAFLFGLVSANSQDKNIDGVTLPQSRLGKWVQVQKHLASGQFAVVHHGGSENGHYEAITDVKSARAGRYFECCDSSDLDRRFWLDRVQAESEIADSSKSQIILLTLP